MDFADFVYYGSLALNVGLWTHYLILRVRKRKQREHYEKYGSDNIDNALQRWDA